MGPKPVQSKDIQSRSATVSTQTSRAESPRSGNGRTEAVEEEAKGEKGEEEARGDKAKEDKAEEEGDEDEEDEFGRALREELQRQLGTPESEASTIIVGSIEDTEMQIKENAVTLFPFAVEHFRQQNPQRIKGSDAFEVWSLYDTNKRKFRGQLIYRKLGSAKPAAYSVWCETKKEAFEKLFSLTKLNIYEDEDGNMEKLETLKVADDDEWIYEYDCDFDDPTDNDDDNDDDDD